MPPAEAEGRVDLHTHSSASDGALTPAELARAAKAEGLAAAALTDHDTIDGLADFMAEGKAVGLEVIGGVEISLEHSGTMHLLGLNAAGVEGFPAALARLKTYRVERNLKMLDILGRQGYYLSWDKLLELARGGQMGRPHFAALLLQKGYFKTRDEVFEQLLGKGKPGYVDKIRLSPEEGLAMLREVRWAPVLAHPVSLGLEAHRWPGYIDQLKSWGLAGLEVHHPSHNPDQVEFFSALARKHGLVATAGSDYHGEFKPAAGLNWTRLNSPAGREMIEALAEKAV